MPEKATTARYIKGGFILLKSQVLASITSFIIYLLAFLFLTKNAVGFAIYSTFSMIAIFLFVYSDAFKIAKDDLKPHHKYSHYPLKGAALEIVPVIITTIIIVAWQLVHTSLFRSLAYQNSIVNTILVIIQAIFVGYTFPFHGYTSFLPKQIYLLLAYIL